jgi:hypothetical protein
MLTQDVQVKHTGSLLRSSLKSTIFNALHLWGIFPSAEQQATMTPDDYRQFVAAAVARVLSNKGHINTGTDSNVNRSEFFEFLILICFVRETLRTITTLLSIAS